MALCKWQGGACNRETDDPSALCSLHRPAESKNDRMEEKITVRQVRVGDWVAEMVEAHAKAMPPSYKEQAEVLLRQAQIYRDGAEHSRLITIRAHWVPRTKVSGAGPTA